LSKTSDSVQKSAGLIKWVFKTIPVSFTKRYRASMNLFKKTVKPTSIFLAILFLLVSTSYQSASAAMIGTEKFLQAGSNQGTRDYLHQLMAREEIKSALIAQGLDPLEAQLRIQSLTDDEIQLIADKLDDLSAGRGVVIFSMIIVAVIIAAVLIFNFTSITEVFP
jgi:hypothetical protein